MAILERLGSQRKSTHLKTSSISKSTLTGYGGGSARTG
jgi:hypothetical protein